MNTRYYTGLLDDAPRIDAFRAGIRAAVRPGDRVLEIGTGLGTYAFMAARAGAAEVWAVDDGPVVHLAETLAASNGLSHRVNFVRGRLPGVELPGRFDVIIFEDFDVQLLTGTAWRTLAGSVERYLAPGGRMVPGEAALAMAPVDAEVVEVELGLGIDDARAGALDLDPHLLRSQLAGSPARLHLRTGALLGHPATGPALSLAPPPPASEMDLQGRWRSDTPGRIGGVALWFELRFPGGGVLDTGPGELTGPWGQIVLPVAPHLVVDQGSEVRIRVGRDVLDDGAPGWLRWEVRAGTVCRTAHEFEGELAGFPDLSPPAGVEKGA